MPKAGDKCPDCGHRFKAKRYDEQGDLTTDEENKSNYIRNDTIQNKTSWKMHKMTRNK